MPQEDMKCKCGFALTLTISKYPFDMFCSETVACAICTYNTLTDVA